MAILDYIVNLNSSVATALIMTIVGLSLRAKISKALKAGITIGISFTGLNLVIGMLVDNLGPAVQSLIKRFKINLTIIDVGWPATATISYASKVGILIIPLCLMINIVMLITETTETLNVDIWNYWHVAFMGALVSKATGSLSYGLIAAGINVIILLIIADLTAVKLQRQNNLPGVSFANGFSGAYVPIAWLVDMLLNKIPGVKDIEKDPDKLKEKFGFFGEPMFIGTIMGLFIGALAGYEVKNILKLGIKMGAVLALIPKIAGMLTEGITPISNAAREFMKDKFNDKKRIFIGIDPTAIIGHPAAISVGLVLVPVTLLIAIFLPGNKVLPFADLAVLPYLLCMVISVTEGNVFRTLIVGIVSITISLLVATNLAPLFTTIANQANFSIPQNTTMITSIDDGGNPLIWVILQLMKYKKAGITVLSGITSGLVFYNHRRITQSDPEKDNNKMNFT